MVSEGGMRGWIRNRPDPVFSNLLPIDRQLIPGDCHIEFGSDQSDGGICRLSRGSFSCLTTEVASLARPAAQPIGVKRTSQFAAKQTCGLRRDFHAHPPPASRTGTEPSLEASIKQAKVIESALFGHIDDLHIRIAQQRHGL